ncbi:MAG: wax ester/triacylglycerol synthase family O-acyltransferase [Balneolales bacterium]|nr:wax ester/triacylglycerol synthase family O-acyltransferase [Balneolales bacterium]
MQSLNSDVAHGVKLAGNAGLTSVMDGADAAWLRMEQDTNQMVITGLFTLEPAPDWETLQNLIRSRLLIYPPFVCKVTGRNQIPVWQSYSEFNLDQHLIRVYSDKTPGFVGLQKYVSELMSRPLDFNIPLWELHLICEDPDSDNEVYRKATLVAKFHHCIADGIGLVRILLSLATVSPGGAYFEPEKEYSPRRRNDWNDANGAQKTGGTLRQGFENVVKIGRALSKLLWMPKDNPGSFKGVLEVNKQAAWSDRYPLELVKKLSIKYRATINDILLWVACSALRSYLEEGGKTQATEQPPTLRVSVPVNLRSNGDLNRTGNRFGLIFLNLPVGEEDKMLRLRTIQQEMNQIKQSGEAVVVYGVLSLLGRMPLFLEKWVIKFLSKKCTAVFTNVPGPRRQLFIAGSALTDIMFWVPKSGNLGLGISIISYDNAVRIGVASDSGLMKDPDRLVYWFGKEFEELLDEVV